MFSVRAPDHLGDGVLAEPAIRALCDVAEVFLTGPSWIGDLYRDLPTRAGLPDRADTAVLFKPSFSAAWRTRHARRRIGLATDGRWFLLTDALVPAGRHRQYDYDQIARAAGAAPSGAPRFPLRDDDRRASESVAPGTTLLIPGSASGETVNWPRYRALADKLAAAGDAVLFGGGPGQEAALKRLAGPHPVLPTLPIGAFAAVACAASAVVGNDSGLTHLSVAARRAEARDPASVHGIAGSTAPLQTGAPGATWHGAPSPGACWPCYKKRCSRGLQCLDMPLDPVFSAVQATLHP